SPADLTLYVETERLTWSGHFEWTGRAVLRDRGGNLLWKSRECDGYTTAQVEKSYCEILKRDFALLGDHCPERVVADLSGEMHDHPPGAKYPSAPAAGCEPLVHAMLRANTMVLAGPD